MGESFISHSMDVEFCIVKTMFKITSTDSWRNTGGTIFHCTTYFLHNNTAEQWAYFGRMLLRGWGSSDEGAASHFYIFNQKYFGAFHWFCHQLIYCSLMQKRSRNDVFWVFPRPFQRRNQTRTLPVWKVLSHLPASKYDLNCAYAFRFHVFLASFLLVESYSKCFCAEFGCSPWFCLGNISDLSEPSPSRENKAATHVQGRGLWEQEMFIIVLLLFKRRWLHLPSALTLLRALSLCF